MANGKKQEDAVVTLRSDRRKGLRKDVIVTAVKGEDGRGVFFGYAKVLGPGGMYISTVNPRSVGDEFTITFKVADAGLEVNCRCVVAWVREFDSERKAEPGMGLRFIDLPTPVRDKIEEWVRRK